MVFEGQHESEATFPAHCTPENKVSPAEGDVFVRLISTDPLDPVDFKTHAELNRYRPGDAQYCQACTISLFAPLDKGIDRLRKRVHGQRKSRTQQTMVLEDRFAVANGTDLKGVIEEGRSGHYSWWIMHGRDRLKAFNIQVVSPVIGSVK